MTAHIRPLAEEIGLPPAMLLPRGLIFLSFLWLVVSWGVVIGFRPPMQPSPASYEPGVRLMLVNVLLGLLVGWPLWRLSTRRVGWPIRQTLLDLMVMLSMAQVVVWPLRLVTTWSRERTAVLDLLIILWTLATAAIVSVAIGSKRSGARTIAMIGCVAIVIAGPAVAVLFNRLGVTLGLLMDSSPLVALYEVASAKGSPVNSTEWGMVAAAAIAAAVAWTAVGLVSAIGRRGGEKSVAAVC